jgi:hypothetical protein
MYVTKKLLPIGVALLVVTSADSLLDAQRAAGSRASSGSPGREQARSAFEGVWDEIRLRDGNAAEGQKPNHMRRMFLDGYYSLTNASEGRRKIDKPVAQMTREELLDRFRSLQVQDGTYEMTGPNRILLKRRISQFPENHGTEQVMEWSIDASGVLSLKIISDTGSAPVGQVTTYKRLK